MRLINKLILLLYIIVFFNGCQSVKDTLSLKKERGRDEFLIEKKNPLVFPPDFSEMPVPKDEAGKKAFEKDSIDLSKVLNQSGGEKKVKSSDDLEKSILEILNKK